MSDVPPTVAALALPEGPFFLIAKVSDGLDSDVLNAMLLNLEYELHAEVGQRGRVIALAGDITLEALGDDDLSRLGLERCDPDPARPLE